MIINDKNAANVMRPGGYGCVPRDYGITPMRSPPSKMVTIPQSEWSARIAEQVATKSRLSDVRGKIPSLNQGQWGYCWAHSTTMAMMIRRAVNGMPYVPLSAFAIAATIKNGANEGGWGALSLDFATKRGIPSQAFWPQGNANPATGTPECWADAEHHKVMDAWTDLDLQAWDEKLSFEQVATCLLLGEPVIADFDWWGHSVCLLDLVEIEQAHYGVRFINSWGDEWGDRGLAVLSESKSIPSGASSIVAISA